MRILFLSPLSELGGAERCLLDLLASLRDSNPAIDLHLAVSNSGPLADEAEALKVSVHIEPMPRALSSLGDSAFGGSGFFTRARMIRDASLALARTFTHIRRLRRLVREISPDIIHSNTIKSHILAALASGGTPVVWHIRDLISLRPMVARALRLVAPKASAAIAISKLVERDARLVLGELPIHVVYDAIDTDAFSPGNGNGQWLDALAGLEPAPANTLRVGLIATYARWKGQDVFIEAIGEMPPRIGTPATRYYIVGGPIYETSGSQFAIEELRSLVESLHVADRVGFVPFQHDVVKVYRSLDVVVHASTQPEPFGRTIAEAMACGRVVLFVEGSGAAEVLPANLRDAGIPAGDFKGLALAISHCLNDNEARAASRAVGRIAALESFSRTRLASEITTIYRRVNSPRD